MLFGAAFGSLPFGGAPPFGAIIFIAITEAGAASDAASASVTVAASLAETGAGADAASANATLSAAVAEAASGLDAVSATITAPVSITVAGAGLDAISIAGQAALMPGVIVYPRPQMTIVRPMP